MPTYQTFVTQLLQIYHGRQAADAATLNLPTADQVEYLCAVGLGPIARQVYGDAFEKTDPTLFSVLQSADLTVRVLYSQLEKATLALTIELQEAGITPVLLKGISAADEFYQPAHLRLMSDIDILIQRLEVDVVMAKVAALGYEITDEQWRNHDEGEHHLPEARHPATGVTIEVHIGLFAKAEFYAEEPVFQPDNIRTQTIEFNYQGVGANRFTPEFQLVYTLSKWSADRDWAVNLKNINDIIHILNLYQARFDWAIISAWYKANPHLFSITTALLHYLEQANILKISPQMREILACADHPLSATTLKLLAWLLRTYPFNSRNKLYDGHVRWYAHAAWLYLTKPASRDLGIAKAILHQFYLSALYGRYSPISKILSALKSFNRPSQ